MVGGSCINLDKFKAAHYKYTGHRKRRWAEESPFELRHVTAYHYDANNVASEATFLQAPTQKLRAIPHQLRRSLNRQPIDGSKQGWGLRDIPPTDDETIAQRDTEGDNRIISPPRNPRTHRNELKPLSSHVFTPPPPPIDQIPPPPPPPTHLDTTPHYGPVQAESPTQAPLFRTGESDEQDTTDDIKSTAQNQILPNKDRTGLDFMTMETDRNPPRETYVAADAERWHIFSSSDEEKPTTSRIEMNAREFATKLPIVDR